MPLTDEQKAALTLLKSADAKEFADALRAEANDHYQAIFRVGFGAAKGEYETKLQAAQAEAETLRGQVQEKDQALQQVQQGDMKALQERITTLEQAAQKAKAEAQEARTAATDTLKRYHRDTFEQQVYAELLAAHAEPRYAKNAVMPEFRSRIEADETGAVRFLDDDGTPVQAASGELHKVVAKKILATIPPEFIQSRADKGGGASGGRGAAGSGRPNQQEIARQKATSGDYAL